MKLIYTLGQYIGGKALVDQISLPPKYYRTIDKGLNELESWSSMFNGLELDKPQTVFQTGLKVLRRVSKPEESIEINRKSLISFFANKNGYVRLENLNTFQFYQDIIQTYYDQADFYIEGEKGDLYKLPLGKDREDFHFYETHEDDADVKYLPFLPHLTDAKERREKINTTLASLFWKKRNIIKLDIKDDIIEFKDLDPIDRKYEGELSKVFQNLKTCKEKDIRRSLLFQGPPGTGKSTLVFNLAESVSSRTVVVTHQFMEWVNDNHWNYVISHLQPEMLIVDDIDRISRTMERKLSMFEDHYCDIPFILMTSNHYNRLPDAFKRPGRIDEIIEMQNPSKEIRYEVIRSIAKQEELDIVEDRMEILDKIHEEYPGAYIVELFRRIKAYGWDYEIPSYDLTFTDMDEETRQTWNKWEVLQKEIDTLPNGEVPPEDLDPLSLEIQDIIGGETYE